MCSLLNGECFYIKYVCVVLRYFVSKEVKEVKIDCYFVKW